MVSRPGHAVPSGWLRDLAALCLTLVPAPSSFPGLRLYFCLISSGPQAGRPLLGTCILAHFSKPPGWARGSCSPSSHCPLSCHPPPKQCDDLHPCGANPPFSPLDPPLPRSSHVTLPASPTPGMVPRDLKLSAALSRSLRTHCRRTAPGASRNACTSAFGMRGPRAGLCVIDQEGKAGDTPLSEADSVLLQDGLLGCVCRGRAIWHSRPRSCPPCSSVGRGPPPHHCLLWLSNSFLRLLCPVLPPCLCCFHRPFITALRNRLLRTCTHLRPSPRGALLPVPLIVCGYISKAGWPEHGLVSRMRSGWLSLLGKGLLMSFPAGIGGDQALRIEGCKGCNKANRMQGLHPPPGTVPSLVESSGQTGAHL